VTSLEVASDSALRFPDGFAWGTSTAAYQIEGAAHDDGRGPSIWDTYSHTPGRVARGETGDVACDHYHRFEADLDLMASLGLTAYRFSVAWPRVMPTGAGPVNQAGLDFYRRLVDGLVERDITPLVTLYHWDLPEALQARGGWANRDVVGWFGDYASVVAAAIGDAVPTFTTLNEPWCSAFLGHATGVHAPGVTDDETALRVAHHLNLAHGAGASAVRAEAPQARISISLNLAQVYPASADPEDAEAARHVDGLANRIFLDPVLRGFYPDDVVTSTRGWCDWSFVRDGDLAAIAVPLDVLGVNYYSPSRIAGPRVVAGLADRPTAAGRWTGESGADPVAWPGTDQAWSVPQPGPYTDMGWRIEPSSFRDLLTRVARDYPEVPLMVTENGCAYADGPDERGRVADVRRIGYLHDHLAAVHGAIEDGADIRGYYLWSFMDNFEWSLGYAKRFGIVHVDYDTLERTPKDSARWYAAVAAANALPAGAGEGSGSEGPA
jgi:beta-glucosidase